MDDRWTWVALALVPGVGFGTRRYHALLELGDPPALFQESHARLASAVGDEVAGRSVASTQPGRPPGRKGPMADFLKRGWGT